MVKLNHISEVDQTAFPFVNKWDGDVREYYVAYQH